MHVVQLLLPVFDNTGQPFPSMLMREIREELIIRFGGITAFTRAPAQGVWRDHGEKVRDEIVLVEVMVKTLDKVWWRNYRIRLEQRLRQKSIIVRSTSIQLL